MVTAPVSAPTSSISGWRRILSAIPWGALALSTLLALLPLVIIWHAQSQAPAGWRFTGNVSISPDLAQYRSWMRQAGETGLLVDNRFTTEPNKPYIPVPFYYGIATLSSWTGQDPEFVYVYSGALLGIVFGLLLYATVRVFFKSRTHVWWVYCVILFGGGLGAHLKVISGFDFVKENPMLRRLIVEAIWSAPLFEDYRSHYVFVTLFDPHFTLIWTLALASMLTLYLTLERFSWVRVIVMGLLFSATALVHFFEGPLLLFVTSCVAAFCWHKKVAVRPALTALIVGAVAVAITNGTQALLYSQFGLPGSWQRFFNILVATLLISFPVGWLVIATGLATYWRNAGLRECFLLGWLSGCLILTLSGPFNPEPDRGTMTMQVPVYLIAGAIYFSRWKKVTALAAAVAVATLAVTPAWALAKRWQESFFTDSEPYKFMSAEHDAVLDLLRHRASKSDVLLADEPELLWLAPEYQGRHYCGHWFLCVNYQAKKEQRNQFFAGTPEDQLAFLTREKIRFVFVSPENHPDRFSGNPHLVPLKSTGIGSLFEVAPLSMVQGSGAEPPRAH
jgi:hypothetical protein